MSGVLGSTVSLGTAPFSINSTTLNTNLNADMVDGFHANELMGDFGHSFGSNGYQKLSSGLIIEWGQAQGKIGSIGNALNGGLWVDFPLAFPTNCLNVTMGDLCYTNETGSANAFVWSVDYSSITQTHFRIIENTHNTNQFGIGNTGFVNYVAILCRYCFIFIYLFIRPGTDIKSRTRTRKNIGYFQSFIVNRLIIGMQHSLTYIKAPEL
jgi:hypothetical protein